MFLRMQTFDAIYMALNSFKFHIEDILNKTHESGKTIG